MSVFNRDMSIEVLRNGLGILKIPEGITELSVDFALVFDWIPEKSVSVPSEKYNCIWILFSKGFTALVICFFMEFKRFGIFSHIMIY